MTLPRPHSRRRLAPILALALLAGACTPYAEIPPGTIVTCSTAADCPKGQVCNKDRCVAPEEIGVPPELVGGRVTVSADRVTKGDTFTVGLEVTKQLDGAPTVFLGFEAPAALTCTSTGANGWSCPYTVSADGSAENGGKGGRVSIDVHMVDLSGNVANRNGVGTVELDFAAPVLASQSVEPANVPLGGVIQVFLTASEELGAVPALEASRPFEAGGATRFPLARQGETLNYVFTRLVGTADLPGPVSFTVELIDLVGNVSPRLPVGAGAIAVDNAVPVISSLSASPARLGKVGVLTVAFGVSEPVADVRATVGTRQLSCSAGTADSWSCTRAMTGTEIADGTEEAESILVEVADAAGNRDLATSRVVFDFAPPTLASVSLPQGTLPLGGNLQVVLTPGEALGAAPVLVASRALRQGTGTATRFPLAAQGGTLNFSFVHAVDPADPQGTVSLTVEMVDQAGNAATASVGSVALDSVVPAITNLQTSSSSSTSLGAPLRLRPGVTLTASFDTSEPAGALAVTAGGRPMACGARQPASPSYTCTRPVAAGDLSAGTEAAQTVLVALADAAGNPTSASTTVVYDFKAPALTVSAPTYLPAADNPLAALATVGAAKTGTKVRVVVTSDEPLAVAPVMTPASQGLPYATAAGSFAGTTVTLEATVAAQADGSYSTTFSALDVAGNGASFTVGPVAVRTSTPVLTVDQAQVTYLRSPWGNAAPEALGAFTIPAGPYYALAPPDPLSNVANLAAGTFTIDRGTLKAVRVWSDAARATLLGTVPRNVAGDWPRARLASADLHTVWVTALDEAGNESGASRITHGEWVATPNANVAGASPIALTTTSHVEATLAQSLALDAANALAAGADTAAARVASAATWYDRNWLGNQPDARQGAAMVYDSQRGRVVLLGGDRGASVLQDTWEWDGTNWTRMATTMPGGARTGHAMAYDASRGRVVLFGGNYSATAYLGDTWEWDGVRCTQVAVGGGGPGTRAYHAMAYDSARRRVVLMGGEVATGPSTKLTFQDTWEWDGTSWVQVATTMVGGGRSHHAMAYDAARGQVVLYGGTATTDTWVWNGTAWSQAATAMPGGARTDHAMAYDVARGRVVLTGGSSGGNYQQDTWEWTGTAWVTAATTLPGGARQGHAMAYDGARGRTVLFGGVFANGSGPVYLQDVEEWNGTSWALAARPSPSARGGHAMAYDASRGRVVLVGGTDGTSWFQDTWEWDGTGWTQVATTLPGGARAWTSLAYDGDRQRLVLFGGSNGSSGAMTYLQNTCEWTGTGWTQVASTMAGGARERGALAYDSGNRRTILFGGTSGTNYQDTWAWNGSTWSSVATTGPGARYGHAIAYDASRGRVVLLGGTNGGTAVFFADTWELGGSTWNQVASSFPGGGRQGHGMVYDGARQKVLVYGGQSYLTAFQDTWEWDGSTWVTTSASSPAGLRRFHGMAYDDARGRVVVFGGGRGAYDATTWELDEAASTRSAIGVALSLADSGLSLAVPPTSIRVRAFVGATFGTPASAGAVLHAWTRGSPSAGGSNTPGAWLPLAANSTGAAAAAPWLPAAPASLLPWTTSDPWRYADPGTLSASFQLAPGGGAGRSIDGASVALDYIEFRVRYTAP